MLVSGEAQAVVFDAPTLQYWAAREGNGQVQVVGPVFMPEKYAIAIGDGSALRKPINQALLQMIADGIVRPAAGHLFDQKASIERTASARTVRHVPAGTWEPIRRRPRCVAHAGNETEHLFPLIINGSCRPLSRFGQQSDRLLAAFGRESPCVIASRSLSSRFLSPGVHRVPHQPSMRSSVFHDQM